MGRSGICNEDWLNTFQPLNPPAFIRCCLKGNLNWTLYLIHEKWLFSFHCPGPGISSLVFFFLYYSSPCFHGVQINIAQPKDWTHNYYFTKLINYIDINPIKVEQWPKHCDNKEENNNSHVNIINIFYIILKILSKNAIVVLSQQNCKILFNIVINTDLLLIYIN